MSDTGLEQAVAAPKTVARASIKYQFSGPFRPLPPDTTISASAMVTLSVTLSTAVTLSVDFEVEYSPSRFSALEGCSFRPKAFDERLITALLLLLTLLLKALLV